MPLVGLDLGRSSLKCVAAGPDGRPRPLADPEVGALRRPAALVPGLRASPAGADLAKVLLEQARARAGEGLQGLAVTASDGAGADALGAALAAAAGGSGLRTAAVPAPVAVALALTDPPGGARPDGARDAVVDVGESLRLAVVCWRSVGGESFPYLDAATALDLPVGGASLGAALVAVARGGATAVPFELKELLDAGRGPFQRPTSDGVVEVGDVEAREAVAKYLAELDAALPTLRAAVEAARADRVLVAGGLLHLRPVRARLERALAGAALAPPVLAPAPLFAASEGALRALSRRTRPVTARPLALAVRSGSVVTPHLAVPEGAELPGRFGPWRVRAAQAGEHDLQVTDGPDVLVARVPAPATPFEVWLEWTYAAGWALVVSPPGGGEARTCALAPADAAVAQGVREALSFDWLKHSGSVPLDLVFAFPGTGGDATPVLAEAAAKVAAAAVKANPSVRLRGLAVGDHPWGYQRPAYVAAPGNWVASPSELAHFVTTRLAEPLQGTGASLAFECALKQLADLDWRNGAERLAIVVAECPPHLPEEPPYCAVKWEQEAARLKEKQVRLVPVQLTVRAVMFSVRQKVLQFLGGLSDAGVEALKKDVPEPVLRAVERAASRRRLEPRAQAVSERVRFSLE